LGQKYKNKINFILIVEFVAVPGQKRLIVIDGSNVGYSHGLHETFSLHGVCICIEYFTKMGHEVSFSLHGVCICRVFYQDGSRGKLLPTWSLFLYRVFYQDGSRGKLLPTWSLYLYRAFHVTLPKQVTKRKFCCLEGTASVISSDPPCKDGNARFTRVLFKALSDQLWIRTPCFCFRNCDFSAKVTCAFLAFKRRLKDLALFK